MGTRHAWLGRHGERRAARYLRRKGYRILATNVRGGRGEIDILARFGRLLIVVEVRYRKDGILAADLSIDRRKELRLRAAWREIRGSRGLPLSTPVRFDLVLLGPTGPPAHVPGALSAG